MDKHAGFMKALKCRECGREYPLTANHVCEFDFGPLEVVYDYDRIKQSMTRAVIESRPKGMWRFRELLPVAGEPTVGLDQRRPAHFQADRRFPCHREQFAEPPHPFGPGLDDRLGHALIDEVVIIDHFERPEIKLTNVVGGQGIFPAAFAAFERLHETGMLFHKPSVT